MSKIFELDYSNTLLENISGVNPKIYGDRSKINQSKNNLCVPLNAAVAYPIAAEFYNKISSHLSIEIYVAISRFQASNPMKFMFSSMWGAGIALGEIVDETGT